MPNHDPAWWPYQPERDFATESDSLELGDRVAQSLSYGGFLVAPGSYSLGQFRTAIEYCRAEWIARLREFDHQPFRWSNWSGPIPEAFTSPNPVSAD